MSIFSMREKFGVTKGFSRAKRETNVSAKQIKWLKKIAHRRVRRASKIGREFRQISTLDVY